MSGVMRAVAVLAIIVLPTHRANLASAAGGTFLHHAAAYALPAPPASPNHGSENSKTDPDLPVTATIEPGASPESAPAQATRAFSIVLAIIGLACALWVIRRRLYDPETPGATPEPPMGRIADWPMLLLAGIVIWLAQTLGAASASMLIALQDEERRTLRGIALLSAGGYIGAAVGAALVLGSMPGMARLIRADAPFRRDGVLRGLAGFAVVFPIVMTIGWIAASASRWIKGEPVALVAHDTLRLLSETDPSMPHQQAWWWIVVASVLIGAPLVEELVYRGFIQSAVRRAMMWRRDERAPAPSRRLASWTAILVTSGLFSIMHLGVVEPHAAATLFTLSIAFGVVYERTRRLAAPMVMHLLFNTANLALSLI